MGSALTEKPPDPEFALLVLCLRAVVGLDVHQQVVVPAEGSISWARFLWLADRHQVIPLTWAALGKKPANALPLTVRALLEQRCRTIAAHNLSLSGELLGLLAAFREKGISATPFKGPALATALYGTLSHRQISDLDLFVTEERFPEATEVLELRGYQVEDRAKNLSRSEIRARFKDVLFTHPGTGVHLDLHWSVAEPEFDRKLSSMPVPNCVRTVELLGEAVPMQAPEDLLLLLCVHGLRHRWECLKWICDIAALLLRYPSLDWAAALKSARTLGRERTLLLGVYLASHLVAWTPPPVLELAIKADSMLPVLGDQIERSHVTECPQADLYTAKAVLGAVAFDAMRLRSREKTSERIAFLLHLLGEKMRPSAVDRQWIALPLSASMLYWLLRPVRILRHYGARCSLEYLSQLVIAARNVSTGT